MTFCRPQIFLLLALAAPLAPGAQTVLKDVPYTAGEKADLYMPAGPGPFPAIVYIHGGSWRSGNKGDYKKLATDLSAQGYAGFSIDYDLDPHSFPTSWQQALDAVRFVRAHAAEYHIDPARIVVAGDSAGGQLAALVALAPQGPATNHEAPAPVAAAILLNGIYNLDLDASVITRYLGVPCGAGGGTQESETCLAASPMHYVHAGAPPIFVGHGTADHTVPYAQATALIDALRNDKVLVANYVATGGHHSYWREKEFYEPNLKAIEYFLDKKAFAKTP